MLTDKKYAINTIWTDTESWDVIGVTEKSVTLRKRLRTTAVATDTGEFVHYVTIPDPNGMVITRRLRKDGTVRRSPSYGTFRFTDTEPTDRWDRSF